MLVYWERNLVIHFDIFQVIVEAPVSNDLSFFIRKLESLKVSRNNVNEMKLGKWSKPCLVPPIRVQ